MIGPYVNSKTDQAEVTSPGTGLWFRKFVCSRQRREWFDMEGERRLMESVEESSGRLQETLQSFTTFLSEANVSTDVLCKFLY